MYRELDKWIAEKVMGWWLVHVKDMPSYWAFPIEGEPKKGLPQCARMCLDWQPTESISDAFQVVEKMTGNDFTFELEYWPKPEKLEWKATFSKQLKPGCHHSVKLSETAPLAICLAAKEAL